MAELKFTMHLACSDNFLTPNGLLSRLLLKHQHLQELQCLHRMKAAMYPSLGLTMDRFGSTVGCPNHAVPRKT
jgi:hypothetical protein